MAILRDLYICQFDPDRRANPLKDCQTLFEQRTVGLGAHVECLRNRADDKLGICDRGEIDEKHAVRNVACAGTRSSLGKSLYYGSVAVPIDAGRDAW